MRSDELITAVRISGGLPRVDPTYDDARLLIELTDTCRTLFERPIVNSREGYWLHEYTVSTAAGVSLYRLPTRAVTQTCERVDLLYSGRYVPLEKMGPKQATTLEGAQEGRPQAFKMRGDALQLLPTPSEANTLRIQYYLRPSQLVAQQSSGTVRGRITSFDRTARTITVNAVPFDQLLTSPAAITSALQSIDVVRPDGSHEVVMVGATQTLATSTFTVPVGTDMSGIAVGDFVRVAEQTDWPALPQDFHRTLATATAAVVLMSKGYTQKAQALAAKVSGDIERFTDLLTDRVKDSPVVVRKTSDRWRR